MKAAKAKNNAPTVFCSLVSKKEAGLRIAEGIHHVHSSLLGERDALVRLTRSALDSGSVPTYPWETASCTELRIHGSSDRQKVITTLESDPAISGKRKVRENLSVVLEELLTNAIYHAYRDGNGVEKYNRKSPAQLSEKETLILKYAISREGIYLSLTDQGGSLRFEDLSNALARCFRGDGDQIELKESGAGLGIYMVFDAASHIKVVTQAGKTTTFSLWISDKRNDVDTFSFNFFNVEE